MNDWTREWTTWRTTVRWNWRFSEWLGESKNGLKNWWTTRRVTGRFHERLGDSIGDSTNNRAVEFMIRKWLDDSTNDWATRRVFGPFDERLDESTNDWTNELMIRRVIGRFDGWVGADDIWKESPAQSSLSSAAFSSSPAAFSSSTLSPSKQIFKGIHKHLNGTNWFAKFGFCFE